MMDARNKVFLAVGAVAIVAAAAIGMVKIIDHKGERGSESTQPVAVSSSSTPASSPTAPVTSSAATSGSYKDGEYSADASYRVPGGDNTISVKLTIKDGKIAAVTTNDTYSSGESAYYVDSFNGEIKGMVVGQPLDGVSLSRVGGASLTTEGFNQALDSIISAAKA